MNPRFCQAVLVKLVSQSTGARLCVATYHMPCQFRNPRVMVLHSALYAAWAQVKLCWSTSVTSI